MKQKIPDFEIEGFTEGENQELHAQTEAIANLIAARKEGRLGEVFHAPRLRIRHLSDEMNDELNNRFVSALEDRMQVENMEVMGPIAAAVIGSVAGSVAGTIVSNRLNSREIEPLDDFELEIVDIGRLVE